MSSDRYAAYCCAQGEKLIKVDGIWWREAKPFFFRPLLITKTYKVGTFRPPALACCGGFQHGVSEGDESNSFINLLLFENPQSYSLDQLNWGKRKQVRTADKEFEIRRIFDLGEFRGAYEVYLDFYRRTGYAYRSDRKAPERFSEWAEVLFQFPEVMVLGAYHNGHLGAVSVSHLVEDLLFYSTVFCDTESLKQNVNGLMLHKVREAAALTASIATIFAGGRKQASAKGVDDFYLTRGCSTVDLPAHLRLNLLAGSVVRLLFPSSYRALCGEHLMVPSVEGKGNVRKPAPQGCV